MNIFNPKKKNELNMSVAPQMSMAPRQSVYQQPKQSSFQMSNPVSRFGQSVVSGQGNRAIQSSFARPTVQKQPSVQMSRPQQPQQPQQSRVIQGSGMGTRYASNPTNYNPKPVAPPVSQPQPQAPQDSTQKYLDMLSSRAGQKQAFIGEQRAAEEAATKARYGLANEQIKSQLPTAQNNFNTFKQNTLAGVDDVRASGERQKSNTSDYYGEAQRLAAKTLGETRAQDQRTFSNLNTIDSYGEGSFKQANENTTSEFNRFTQQTLKEKAQKLSEIDQTVGAAEREATSLISQEEAKLQEFSQQIQFALMNNDQMMAEELRGLATQSQQLIYDLYDAVDNLKYSADLEKYKLELEKNDDLSPEFLTSGVPQTEADYIWKINNAKEYGEAFPNLAGNSESRQKMSEALDTSDLIDRVLRSNTDPLTGTMRLQGGWNPEAKLKSQETASLIEQVSNQLQLAAAGKLKGQGQITENERAILRSAVLALNPDGKGGYAIGDGELRKRLTEAQNILLRDSGLQDFMPQVDNATLVKQFGG